MARAESDVVSRPRKELGGGYIKFRVRALQKRLVDHEQIRGDRCAVSQAHYREGRDRWILPSEQDALLITGKKCVGCEKDLLKTKKGGRR